MALALAVPALLMPAPLPAVVILDSTWREEGGRPGREADGFGAHIRLANEPQFRSLVTLSFDGGATWGVGSGTWIGNDGAHGYLLTSAHNFDDATVDELLVRTDGGTVLRGDRLWLHPGYDADEERTGVDAAIVRLVRPVEDAGPAPLLYAGRSEKGKTITFVGFGTRGIASRGEDERYNTGTGKAAAQGVVDEAVPLRRLSATAGDPGNHLTVFLPREDGRIENPYGGARRPASRLAGLLGAGDSGGSAWMPLGDGWVVVGINTSGDGQARYGDSSWFVRVSGIRPWIASVFPGAAFADDHGRAPERPAVDREPVRPAVGRVPEGPAVGREPARPAVGRPVATPSGCREEERLFVLSDGAWYPARVRGPGDRPDACHVRFDGYSAGQDEVAGRSRMVPWSPDGPGRPLDACSPGAAVVAEEDGVWYPATVRRAAAKGCVVRYEDEDYEDEVLPLVRLRALR